MCITRGSVRTEDEPTVGPRPITYTVTPMSVPASRPLPDMIVAPRIQTVRPSSRSPRASRTSQNSRPRPPSSRHSSASIPLRPLSSHTPPLSPLSASGAIGPDLPHSLQRRRVSAVVVIEHQHSAPHIVNARPGSKAGSKPSSLRTRDSPRTSERNVSSPITVTSPGPGPDVVTGVSASNHHRRRASQQPYHIVEAGNTSDENEKPITIIRYRSQTAGSSDRARRSSATSPRGSGSSVLRGSTKATTRTPRSSGNVSIEYGSPLHHAATAPTSTSPSTSTSHRKTSSSLSKSVVGSTEDTVVTSLGNTERVVTSPAALMAGANVTVGVLSQQSVGGEKHREQRRNSRSRPVAATVQDEEDEVVGSEPSTATAAGPKVKWDDDKDHDTATAAAAAAPATTINNTTTNTKPTATPDPDRLLKVTTPTVKQSHHQNYHQNTHHRRRRSSPTIAYSEKDPRASTGNVSMRSVQSNRSSGGALRERVLIVDEGANGRAGARREYRRVN